MRDSLPEVTDETWKRAQERISVCRKPFDGTMEAKVAWLAGKSRRDLALCDWDPAFKGEYQGETHKGAFLISESTYTQSPELVVAILQQPGTRLTVVGTDRGSTTPPITAAQKARVQFVPGKVHRWTQDFRALDAVDKSTGKSVLVQPRYFSDREDDAKFPKEVQSKLVKKSLVPFPLQLEGGNILRVQGKNGPVSLISNKFLEEAEARGVPRTVAEKIAKQYFGEVVFLPFNDPEWTGHVDMDMLPLVQKDGSHVLAIGDPNANARSKAIAKYYGQFKDLKDLHPSDFSPEATERFLGMAKDSRSYQDNYAKMNDALKSRVPLIHVPYTSPHHVRTANGGEEPLSQKVSVTKLNGLSFLNSDGKRVLIYPTYDKIPGDAQANRELEAALKDYVDIFLPVPTELNFMQGVFHCVAPQPFGLP